MLLLLKIPVYEGRFHTLGAAYGAGHRAEVNRLIPKRGMLGVVANIDYSEA
ncbi:hypothetical protein GCM10007082_26190 [Oceanisphaera arctica]|nr:hypothetical protein GCM10007082_26190 [Oceanisphaera arctica]